MRFFSNEAKDNVDEQDGTGTRDDNAVPQQRAGSPWQHSRTDDTETIPPVTGPSTAAHPADGDDDPDRTSPLPDSDRTVAFKDGSDSTTPFGGGATSTEPVVADSPKHTDRIGDDTPVDTTRDDHGTFDDPNATQPIRTGTDESRHTIDKDGDGVPDASETGGKAFHESGDTIDDKSGDTAFDSTATRSDDKFGDKSDDKHDTSAFDTTADKFDDKHDSTAFGTTTDKTDGTTTDKADNTVFDTTADKTGDEAGDETGTKAVETTEPLVPVATTGSTISGPAPFFPSSDTQPLRDKWRDVQLRFVDDPKAATADAAELVDEAVDKLTKSLRDHRGSFAKGTDDTESLRVELRSYRDILDRLLGL